MPMLTTPRSSRKHLQLLYILKLMFASFTRAKLYEFWRTVSQTLHLSDYRSLLDISLHALDFQDETSIDAINIASKRAIDL